MARILKGLLIIILLFAMSAIIFWGRGFREFSSDIDSAKQIKTEIVLIPHLDTAKKDRISFLDKLEFAPDQVVILSTNHFGSSGSEIIYDNQSWSSSSGKIKGSETDAFREFANSHDLIVNDHGIRNPITDLNLKFNKASYTNFLIKPGTSDQALEKLSSLLKLFCENKSCLIVGSVDLSHDNPSSIADLHDQFTLNALFNLDQRKIKNAETDSPEILNFLIKTAKENELNGFELSSQNNTGKFVDNFDKETTSWVTGKFISEPTLSKNATLMFSGDIMMDRLVNHKFQEIGFDKIFLNFKNRIFKGVDASVGNLEGPVSEGPIKDDISPDNLIFNFPLASLDALKSVGLSGFSLANNHTLNDSDSGLARTRSLLTDKKLFSFGSPDNIDEYSVYRLDSQIPVSLIGINQLAGYDEDSLRNLILKLKQEGRYTIVYPHWGAEYQTTHGNSQQVIAYRLIDWGADLVIGSHPHVIQDSEIYHGKLIIYSLGNFVFDQLFSNETQQGLIVNLLINEKRVKVGLIPVISKNMQVELMQGDQKQAVLDRVIPSSLYQTRGQDGTIELER
jgi:poly-gamma-glutamate synthesis protein (capsule biosynthesis protein)